MALILFLFTSLCGMAAAYGSCYPSHPQKAVCDAHYVVRARYMETIIPGLKPKSGRSGTESRTNSGSRHPSEPRTPKLVSDHVYRAGFINVPQVIKVRLEKIYKGIFVVNASAGDEIYITIASIDDMPLKPERLYLFTGFVAANKLYTTNCHWNPLWEDVTLAQRFGLKRFYWMYCRCNVEFCPDGMCGANNRACQWDMPITEMTFDRRDCHSKYNICVAKAGKCQWYSPKGDVKCNNVRLP